MDRGERNGLIIAGVGHILLLGALSLGWLSAKRNLPPPEDALAVDIVDTVSRSPENSPVAAPEIGPQPETPPPSPEESVAPPPEPTPAPPEPTPAPPQPAPKPEPTPQPKPTPKPAPKPEPKPAPKPEPERKPAPAKPEPAKAQPAKSTPTKAPAEAKAKPAPPKSRGKLDSDWLGSVIGKSRPDASPAPLSGPQAASLAAALRSQIKPCWQPPSGAAEINQLVVTVRVTFARDGSLQGSPQVTERAGVNAANQAYLGPFENAARRAVIRCAPVQLPDDLYDYWREVEFPFDVKLSR